MRLSMTARNQFLLSLVLATGVALGMFGWRVLRNNDTTYSYLVWNLFLAWLPLIFALWLAKVLRAKLWSSWEALAASALWLIFLPNSYYMVSDFIHLQPSGTVDLLFDAVMFMAFIYLGLMIGFSSLYLVHMEFKKRFTSRVSASWIGAILLLSSFAIYLGRDLRWNSWDILINPGGLLFDISDRLLQPSSYGGIAVTVLSFFALLASMYIVLWYGIRLIRKTPLV